MDINPTKLIKLLNLSASPIEGESLAAIRKANEHLASANENWETFFAREAAECGPTEELLANSEMLNILLNKISQLPMKTATFIYGLNKYYADHGYLSEKQEKALRRIYGDQNSRKPWGAAE